MQGGKRQGAGRKPLLEKSTARPIRISDAEWAQIPEPKASWIRQAIAEKLRAESGGEDEIHKKTS